MDASLVKKAHRLVDRIDGLYEKNEEKYWKAVEEEAVFDLTDRLINTHENQIIALEDRYAENYAERVFHDRQLCEHIGKTLVQIGFDGRPDWEGPPLQWIRRLNRWPTWAVDAVVARDRGHCAQCGVDITSELQAQKHIDHIIALANGGTNDLSNLQLLCDASNLKKSRRMVDVRSSVPEYLQIARQRGNRGD